MIVVVPQLPSPVCRQPKVFRPISLGLGGFVLKIRTLRVTAYRSTSSHPQEVMAAPAKQYHQYGTSMPVMAAILPPARGKVQTT